MFLESVWLQEHRKRFPLRFFYVTIITLSIMRLDVFPRSDEIYQIWNKLIYTFKVAVVDMKEMTKMNKCFFSMTFASDITVTSHECIGVIKQQFDCLLKGLSKFAARKTSTFFITGPSWRGSTSSQWFPSQRTNHAESVLSFAIRAKYRNLPAHIGLIKTVLNTFYSLIFSI